jgi:hypothetical protein
VGSRAGLDDVEKRKFFTLQGLELVSFDRPSRTQPLYRLCYDHVPFFLISIVGGGVQLGPLGTAATNRPIVPAPGDHVYDGETGGMIIGQEKPKYSGKPAQHRFFHHKSHMLPRRELRPPRWEASD